MASLPVVLGEFDFWNFQNLRKFANFWKYGIKVFT